MPYSRDKLLSGATSTKTFCPMPLPKVDWNVSKILHVKDQDLLSYHNSRDKLLSNPESSKVPPEQPEGPDKLLSRPRDKLLSNPPPSGERDASQQAPMVDEFDINGIADFIGMPKDSVRRTFLMEDLFIQNYFQYEEGSADPIIKGRLKSALHFWREEIKAPHSILSIIEQGYKIEFLTEPPSMSFLNNKSALQQKTFVSEAVGELLKQKLVKEVEKEPYIVSPLSVAKNGDKLRLILDFSILNEYIPYEMIKLEDQREFFEYAKDGQYIATFDIKSCYHQIDMHTDSVRYLGFSWFLDGKKRYFVFLVLPFGLSSAPRICKMLFRPLILK